MLIEHAEKVLPTPAPVRVLGIDETRRGKPRWTRDADGRFRVCVDPWDAWFVVLGGEQGLLGKFEGRTSTAVAGRLSAQTEQFRAEVTHVVIDPSTAYAAVTTDVLPHVLVVVDHFHLVKFANAGVSAIRRQVTFEAHGRRGRERDPEWVNRRRAHERPHRGRQPPGASPADSPAPESDAAGYDSAAPSGPTISNSTAEQCPANLGEPVYGCARRITSSGAPALDGS